jgi:hypothetical protein
LIGGVVDLDLLFQIPQKDARIIGGKGEEASFLQEQQWRRERVKKPGKPLGKKPLFIA